MAKPKDMSPAAVARRARRKAEYDANPKKVLDANKEWRERNAETYLPAHREHSRNFRRENLPKIVEANREYAEKNPEWARNQTLKKYGLTGAEWDAMFEEQGYCCGNPGCRVDEPGSKKGWSTDHCHATGKVRGILCHHCNIALGMARDDPDRLRGLMDYLKHNGAGDPAETLAM